MIKNFIKFSAIAVGIIILGIAVLYGLNYWQAKKGGNNIEPQQPKPDEIIITDLPTGEKLVENKTQGSSLRLPTEWLVDNTKGQFYNSDCKISSSFSNILGLKTIEQLKNDHEKDLLDIGFTVKEKKYQNIKVSGYDALKFLLNTEETGYSITVEVPFPNKIYNYILYSDIDNIKNCSDSFDKIIETISIK